MIDIQKLKPQTKGQWPGIYQSLGINVGTGKHCPCPLCGGTDRFRFDDKNGLGDYYCNGCGAGSGFDLVMKATGKTFPETLETIASVVGHSTVEYNAPSKPDPRKALNKVWKSSLPLTGSDQVSRYLHSRDLALKPDNVRICPACYESETKTNMVAMVARIEDASGKPVSIHRTYLSGPRKAEIKSPKKIMPGTESLKGSAIRLFQPGVMYFEKDVLGVAEGIETAIACTQGFQIATWACISSTILESFIPPEKYKKIVIFGDNDANFTGQKAAYKLAKQLYLKDLIVEVMLPPKVGDWADCG